MSLRERTVKGYVDAYLRSERKLVTDLLRTGCMTTDEWKEISGRLNEAAEDYEEGEKDFREFLETRKEIDHDIRKTREENDTGLTKEESLELYEEYRERHQEMLEQAFMDSERSVLGFLARMPVLRAKHFFSVLKNT